MPRRSPRGKPYHKPKPRDPDAPPPRKHGERSTAPGEHRPVMLAEVLAALDPQPGHVVVDCTLGFAGHSIELLRRVGPTGKLIATVGYVPVFTGLGFLHLTAFAILMLTQRRRTPIPSAP